MNPTESAGTTIEFANGTKVVFPAPDPTLRTDLWVDALDGTYRLFLDMPTLVELERRCTYVDREGNRHPMGVFAIYGAVAKGRYELEGRSVGFAVEGAASIEHCRETVRLALIGGATAIIDGETVRINAKRAGELVETYLAPAPVEDSWNLAYLILHTAIHGRKERPEEVGTRSTQAIPPRATEPD